MSTTPGQPKVFISYRREETEGQAGRLYADMVKRFGPRSVFMDIDMELGIDFVQRIRDAVGACHVLLVIMGPRWATLAGEDGRPRIADPEDFVRLEVETALRRDDVTVIPVLVAGARMPAREALPAELGAMSHIHAHEVTHTRWDYDVGRLMDALDERIEPTDVHQVPAPPPAEMPRQQVHEPRQQVQTPRQQLEEPRQTASPVRLLLEGLLVAGAAGLVARGLGELIKSPEPPVAHEDRADAIVTTILRRGETWAIVGAALAVWITWAIGRGREIAGSAFTGLFGGALAGVVGGALFALPAYLADHHALPHASDGLNVASLAATGAILGGMLGGLWLRRSLATGFLAGMAGGALVQFLGANWDVHAVLFTCVQAVVITGLALGALIAVAPSAQGSRDRSASGTSLPHHSA